MAVEVEKSLSTRIIENISHDNNICINGMHDLKFIELVSVGDLVSYTND